MTDRKVKRGDFVMRRRQCALDDHFKCHPFSFGQVVDMQLETGDTRPDAPHVEVGGSWFEVVVLPFDRHMAPTKECGWIQWCPTECIIISGWLYGLLALTWPLVKRLYRKPLDGRITDGFGWRAKA